MEVFEEMEDYGVGEIKRGYTRGEGSCRLGYAKIIVSAATSQGKNML